MRPAARRLRWFSTAAHGTKGLGVCNHDPMLDTGIGTFEYIPPASEGQNKFSSTIIQKAMAGAQDSASMNSHEQGVLNDNVRQLITTNPLRATRKPQIGISSVWYDGNPCNMHLLEVSEVAKHAVEELGMVPMRFNSIGVSDGISNGTDGTQRGWLKASPWCRLVRHGLALRDPGCTTHLGRAAEPLRAQVGGCGAAVRPRQSRRSCGLLFFTLTLTLTLTHRHGLLAAEPRPDRRRHRDDDGFTVL